MSGSGTNKRSLIITIAVLTAVALALILPAVIPQKVKTSDYLRPGNSAGNLYNLGLFCEFDDRIYFSNYLDDGQLYSMDKNLSDYEKINEDNVRYINVDENYIFYSRMNNLKEAGSQSIFIFYSNGIFRADHNGKNLEMLHSEPVGSLLLYRNKLVYQNYAEGKKLSLRMMDIAGEGDMQIVVDEAQAVATYNDKVYYAAVRNDRSLHSFGIDAGVSSLEISENMYQPVVTNGDTYYISLDDGYKIKCLRSNGSIDTLVKARCSTYNLSSDGKYIYYQRDNGKNNALCCHDMVSGTDTVVCMGDYKWINTVGNYCFFYSFDETAVYVYKQGSLGVFTPDIIEK